MVGEDMGKTRRYHGRENGECAKRHRWWRKVEGDVVRKDTDRFKVARRATEAIIYEGVALKTRNTAIPRADTTKGYGYTGHPFPLEG